MSLASRAEALILATMARGGTLHRGPHRATRAHADPWVLRDGQGCRVMYPARLCMFPKGKSEEGGHPHWWEKKFYRLLERAHLISDHPDIRRAERLYITDLGRSVAFRITRDGTEAEAIPCLHCDRPYDEKPCKGHEYVPARRWARRRTC